MSQEAESTGSTSKTLAVKAERQRRREMEESANGIRAARRPVLFPVAAREWMAANRARWSKSNISIQEFNLKHLSAHFGTILLADITPLHIGKYQSCRQAQKASNRTINMEVSTLRMMMKSARLWSTIADDVRMLPERHDIGRALTPYEEKRLLDACHKSAQPALYPAIVIFCNTGLRNAELRCARWQQVDLFRAEFHVGKAKTEGSEGRIVPLNQTALEAFEEWKRCWPEAKPTDYIFPSEKLVYRGTGAAEAGLRTAYTVTGRNLSAAGRRRGQQPSYRLASNAASMICGITLFQHWHKLKLQTQPYRPSADTSAGRCWSITVIFDWKPSGKL